MVCYVGNFKEFFLQLHGIGKGMHVYNIFIDTVLVFFLYKLVPIHLHLVSAICFIQCQHES